jgi:DNA-binding IclR family transcriptional regulator
VTPRNTKRQRLGQNQITALALLETSPWGQGLTPDDLNRKMGLGPQRCLDVLERLVELGVARRSGSRRFIAE